MKRSKTVQVTLVSSMAALLTGCQSRPDRYCVDEKQNVTDPGYCRDGRTGFGHSYRWHYGGARGYVPLGTHLYGGSSNAPSSGYASSPTETSRGGIGGAGEAATGHASAHAGGGE